MLYTHMSKKKTFQTTEIIFLFRSHISLSYIDMEVTQQRLS